MTDFIQKPKTSMSVMEMGALLGLSKTESYWLVKKQVFTTITAGKRMRVMIDSFEQWYAGQSHYKKVETYKGGNDDGINH